MSKAHVQLVSHRVRRPKPVSEDSQPTIINVLVVGMEKPTLAQYDALQKRGIAVRVSYRADLGVQDTIEVVAFKDNSIGAVCFPDGTLYLVKAEKLD